MFAVSILRSEWFISKPGSTTVGLEFTSTCNERGESIQHFIQLAPVIGNALHQVSELIYRDLATLTHKLHLLLKIISCFEIHSFE
ncbi:hypothetical protein ABVT39_007328, partial [Epinephelus coioides]